VVNRSIQILQTLTEQHWRKDSDLIISPNVDGVPWDGFAHSAALIEAGDAAATALIPAIQEWFAPRPSVNRRKVAPRVAVQERT